MGIKIAIDGPSGSGKSSVAKVLAMHMGLVHIDTGAMYRTVALAAKAQNVDWADESGLTNLLKKINIDIQFSERGQRIFLDGRDVTDDVRTAEMGVGAAKVSIYNGVREKLVDMQRKMAENEAAGVVMDGRDIGTVVLADADFKIFLTADVDVRARRRCGELEKLGQPWNYEEIAAQISRRDFEDMTREVSPLKQADDAVVVDASGLDIAGVVQEIKKIIEGSV